MQIASYVEQVRGPSFPGLLGAFFECKRHDWKPVDKSNNRMSYITKHTGLIEMVVTADAMGFPWALFIANRRGPSGYEATPEDAKSAADKAAVQWLQNETAAVMFTTSDGS